MNKLAKKINLIKHTLIGFVCLLIVGIMIVGDVLANTYYLTISTMLGQITYKTVALEEGEELDSTYYTSEYNYDSRQLRTAQKDFAMQIQGEGAVMLQRGNLPIAETGKITLLGAGCAESGDKGFLFGGGGSGGISTEDALNLKEIFEQAGYTVNPDMWDYYNTGAGMGTRSLGNKTVGEQPFSNMPEEIKNVGNYNDAGIVVISRPGAEATDMPTTTSEDENKHFLELSQNELDLIQFACEDAGFGQVVVLLNTMQAVELQPVLGYENLSIVWIGGAGEQGAEAIPSILNGQVNPSGRLVDTYVNDMLVNDPAVKNQGDMRWASGDSQGTYVVYQEGIYVGYRYYETRYEDVVTGRENVGDYNYSDVVTFPFGYGESYTSFTYSDYQVKDEGDKVTVSVTVTNTGDTEGKEVVQLYMHSPYTDYDIENGIEKEAVQLVGFDKTESLKPGEKETVSMDVPKEYMKAYDAKNAKTYIVDEGDYYFAVGNNAHNALNNILAAEGYTQENGMTEVGDASLAGVITQTELDQTTYSVGENGTVITNELDNASMDYYDSDFQYMTRQNWEGTFPTVAYQLNVTEEMLQDNMISEPESDETVEMPKTEQDNGLILSDMIGLDYDDPQWESLLDEMSYEDMASQLSGYFGSAQVESILKPAVTDSDGPAGITASLGVGAKGYGYPVEVLLSSTWNKELAKRQGELIGEDSLATLVSGWYAPGSNIHRSPFSGRNFEYYSEDSFLSGEFAGTVIAGASSKGVYSFLKHFAINDQETNRVLVNTFVNEQAARQIYLKPFEIAIRDYGCNALMVSMNSIGMNWVGHNKNLLENIVRDEWGFVGMINTDTQGRFAESAEIDTAICTGVDMFLKQITLDDSVVKNNPVIMSELREAMHHTLYVIANSNAMNGISANTKIVHVTPMWVKLLIAGNVVVILAAVIGFIANLRRTLKNIKKEENANE